MYNQNVVGQYLRDYIRNAIEDAIRADDIRDATMNKIKNKTFYFIIHKGIAILK